MQEIRFKYVRQATVVEIIGGGRQKLNGLKTDATGYYLAEIIWRDRNKARRIWWFLCCPHLNISI